MINDKNNRENKRAADNERFGCAAKRGTKQFLSC